MDFYNKIDELLNKPCYVIDILPKRVEKDNGGQYFAVEDYYQRKTESIKIFQKFKDIMLKLNCYYDFQVCYQDRCSINPSPDKLAEWIMQCGISKNKHLNIYIETEDALITVNNGHLYLGLYNLNENLIALARELARSEGLFVWKAES